MVLKLKTLFCILLIVTISLGNACELSAQDKVNINAGFSIPELINLGVGYQIDQFQIGLSVGSLPTSSSESLITFSGDIHFHFAGSSEFSNRRPWYGRLGLNYIREETYSVIDNYLYLGTRVGRDLNISKKIGISIDMGAIFLLNNKEKVKKSSDDWNLDLDFPVLPSVGIGLFYRI